MKKKISLKKLCFPIMAILAFVFLFTACAKEDNGDIEGSLDLGEILGTYKGTIKVFDRIKNLDKNEYFNAIVTVTKVDDKHIRVTPKSGEEYSDGTPKNFMIERIGNQAINSLDSRLIYIVESEELTVTTKKEAENEFSFTFEGYKQ